MDFAATRRGQSGATALRASERRVGHSFRLHLMGGWGGTVPEKNERKSTPSFEGAACFQGFKGDSGVD